MTNKYIYGRIQAPIKTLQEWQTWLTSGGKFYSGERIFIIMPNGTLEERVALFETNSLDAMQIPNVVVADGTVPIYISDDEPEDAPVNSLWLCTADGKTSLQFKTEQGTWQTIQTNDVLTFSPQQLTEEQQIQAQTNIGMRQPAKGTALVYVTANEPTGAIANSMWLNTTEDGAILKYKSSDGTWQTIQTETIQDVTELPTTDINPEIIYKLIRAYMVIDGRVQTNTTCNIVRWKTAPTGKGESFIKYNSSSKTYTAVGYYNIVDGTLWCYFDDSTKTSISSIIKDSSLSALEKALAQAALMGFSTGWKDTDEMLTLVGMANGNASYSYGGTISYLSAASEANTLYAYLPNDFYQYVGGEWIYLNDALHHAAIGHKTKALGGKLEGAAGVGAFAQESCIVDAGKFYVVEWSEGHNYVNIKDGFYVDWSKIANKRMWILNSKKNLLQTTTALGTGEGDKAFRIVIDGIVNTSETGYIYFPDDPFISIFQKSSNEPTKTVSDYAVALGQGTVATGTAQLALGKYNKLVKDMAIVVGAGTSSVPNNIATMDWQGNAWFAGTIKVGASKTDILSVANSANATAQEAKATVNSVNAQVQTISDTVSGHTDKINTLQDGYKQLNTNIKTVNDTVIANKAEVDAKIAEIAADVAAVETQVGQLEETVQSDVAALESAISAIDGTVATHTTAINDLSGQSASLQEQVQEHEDLIEVLNNKCRGISTADESNTILQTGCDTKAQQYYYTVTCGKGHTYVNVDYAITSNIVGEYYQLWDMSHTDILHEGWVEKLGGSNTRAALLDEQNQAISPFTTTFEALITFPGEPTINLAEDSTAPVARTEFIEGTVDNASAFGQDILVVDRGQTALGRFNIPTLGALVIGGGSSDEQRKNIAVIDWQGNLTIEGNVIVGGTPTAANHAITKHYADGKFVCAAKADETDINESLMFDGDTLIIYCGGAFDN